MKPWFVQSQVPLKENVVNTFVSYVELQQPLPDSSIVYNSYILRYSETALLLVAHLNLDQMFHVLEQQLQDPTLAGVYNKTYRETWPYLFTLLDNSVNKRYSQGALFRIEDPDNGDHIWVVGTIVGNVPPSLTESDVLFHSDRVSDAHKLVIQSCAKVIQETSTRQVNKWKLGLRGMAAGATQGQKLSNELAAAWLPKLKDLFGT
jgi:hypothetical protein